MYILKQIPEDFIVKEVRTLKLSDGRFAYLKVKKKSRNTLDVVKEISKQLGIKDKQIGFAGSKDKHAITEQYFSIEGVKEDKVKRLNINSVDLEFLGYGKEAIYLGDLEGNNFEIVVRDLDSVDSKEVNFVANYFDEQRFSLHNVDIGRHIVKKEFDKACKLMDDTRAKQHLEKHEKDYIGAMKKLPHRLVIMYVHAYQSYLWNETLAEYLRSFNFKEVSYSLGKFVFIDEKLDLEIPLLGFDTDFNDPKIENIVVKVLEKEDLELSDFVIKQIPELSREGETRKAFVDVKIFEMGKVEDDELNPGKKKVKVSFTLGKGSYATMAIRKLFA